jgi:hypothetical protein
LKGVPDILPLIVPHHKTRTAKLQGVVRQM